MPKDIIQRKTNQNIIDHPNPRIQKQSFHELDSTKHQEKGLKLIFIGLILFVLVSTVFLIISMGQTGAEKEFDQGFKVYAANPLLSF